MEYNSLYLYDTEAPPLLSLSTITSSSSNTLNLFSTDFRLSPSSDDLNLRSQSLQNISNAQYLESICGAECTKSGSHYSINKTGKQKYDHIQSKVKLYRQEIQKTQKLRKKRLSKDLSKEKIIENEDTSTVDQGNYDKNKKIIEQNVVIEEQKNMIEVLNMQIYDQMQINSNNQIKIDAMRLKINTLELALENMSCSKVGTPKSVRSRQQSQFNIFKTPIRSLSRNLLSPFRSASKTTIENDDDSDESEKGSEYEKSIHPIPETNTKKLSYTSNEPLIRIHQRSKFSQVKDIILSCIKCGSNVKNKSKKDDNLDIGLKKIRFNNEIYPKVGELRKKSTDVNIPHIFLNTPSNKTYILHTKTCNIEI